MATILSRRIFSLLAPAIALTAACSRGRRASRGILLAAAATCYLAAACSSEEPIRRFPDGSLFDTDGAAGVDSGPAADANLCPTQPCDLHEQCGCGYDEACDIDTSNVGETACREVSETFGGHADQCAGSADCRPGFRCVTAADDSLPSFCRRYCQSDDDCPGAGGICTIALTSDGEPTRDDAVMCTFHCDATQTEPASCPEGHGCYIAGGNDDPNSNRHTRCFVPGELGHGDAGCESNSDCRAGHTCAFFDGGGECRRTCIIGQSCPGGLECRNFADPVPRVGADEYGYCG